MIDLRNYKELIQTLVEEENQKDRNWKWSIKSIEENEVSIRWGYLDYLEEKQNCFFVKLDHDDESDWLWAILPDGHYNIGCFLVVEGDPNPNLGAEQTVESGIRDAIAEISFYAHSRY